MSSLLIENIGLLATPSGHSANKGKRQREVAFTRDAYIYIEDDRIVEIGAGEGPEAEQIIDAQGKLVTPGLVDAHTHLIFGGWRQYEMKQKLDNVPYLEILKAGGGILSTVNATKQASKEELIEKGRKVLDEMLGYGSTTVEAKSGYGLCLEEEVKQLEAVKELNETHPIDLVSTFLGAHALPQEYKENRKAFIDKLCDEMIPYVAEHQLAEFCDVFCEKGVFNVQETERILKTGQQYGLRSKIHADEIEAIGGSVLAGEIGAISAEHLIVCDDKGIESLSSGNTIACLLPATSFYLGADYARARDMIDHDVAVALSTDFNPGSCPCLNMQFVMNLGCMKYKMTPEEVLNAVTLNGAAAIGRADTIGSIETGKQADILIWDSPDLNYIFYRLGSNLLSKVIKKGKVVVDYEKAR
ncbi:MAG: imidazolonepropionase [Erysipelotrichaceae bacterium]|nr:imidazolonepropionase [Erysipelotrichaceae bacterium]